MNPGEPSGHGRYGILDDDGERVLCHECGRWFKSVGAHLPGGHGMDVKEYRVKHGLPLSMPLVSAAWAARASASAKARLGSEGWRRLEEARDPRAASAARSDDAIATGARRRYWLERDVRAQKAGYRNLAHALEETRAMTHAEAARAVAVPETTMRRWRAEYDDG